MGCNFSTKRDDGDGSGPGCGVGGDVSGGATSGCSTPLAKDAASKCAAKSAEVDKAKKAVEKAIKELGVIREDEPLEGDDLSVIALTPPGTPKRALSADSTASSVSCTSDLDDDFSEISLGFAALSAELESSSDGSSASEKDKNMASDTPVDVPHSRGKSDGPVDLCRPPPSIRTPSGVVSESKADRSPKFRREQTVLRKGSPARTVTRRPISKARKKRTRIRMKRKDYHAGSGHQYSKPTPKPWEYSTPQSSTRLVGVGWSMGF